MSVATTDQSPPLTGHALDAGRPQSQDLAAQRLKANLRRSLLGASGSVVVGRYELGPRLGAGGFGVVYRATDPELQRQVAVKIVALPADRDRGTAAREAQAMAKISHPHVVEVFDTGVVNDELFVVMELVGGGTMRQWLEGAPPQPSIVAALVDAGRGLVAAHDVGVAHHDFKPDNVLMSGDRARVTDFGLAELAEAPSTREGDDPAAEASDATAAGGTLGYSAPERLAGQRGDQRSDQYAWAVTAFEALTGVLPFAGNDRQARLDAIRRGAVSQPATWRTVPVAMRKAILRGLSYDPQRRFETMAQLLEAFARRPRSRARPMLAVGALVGVATVAAVSVASDQPRDCAGVATVERVFPDHLRQTLASLNATSQVSEDIDLYAQQWQRERLSACQASDGSTAALARIQCLESAADGLRSAVLALTTSHTLASRADALLKQVADPSSCSQAQRVADGQPPPHSAAAVNEARTKAAAAWLLLDHDELAPAEQLLDEVEPLATATRFEPLLAELGVYRGILWQKQRHDQDAVDILLRATSLATDHGMDALVAKGAGQLSFLYGERLGDPDRAEQWADAATAAVERSGEPSLGAPVLTIRGFHAGRAGDHDEALRLLGESLAIFELEADTRKQARVHLVIAQAHLDKQDPDAAEQSVQAANNLLQATDDVDTAVMIQLWDTAGRAALLGGKLEQALGYFDQERDVAVLQQGAEWDNVAIADVHAGHVLMDLGRPADAAQRYAAALEVFEAHDARDPFLVAPAYSGLGRALYVLERDAEAEVAIEKGLLLLEGSTDQDHVLWADLSLLRAQLRLDHREFEAAGKSLARARDAYIAARIDWGVALADFTGAQIAAAQDDRPRARALAHAALETLPPQRNGMRQAIEHWMTEQALSDPPAAQ